MSTTNPQHNPHLSEMELMAPTTKVRIVERQSLQERLLRQARGNFVMVIVVFIALIWSVPTFGLFISSFRPATQIESSGWWTTVMPPWHFTIENYQQVLQAQGLGQAFINSLVIAIPGTLLPVLVAAFAAYAFAWMKFPGRDWFFLIIVVLLIIPIQITLIPILSILTAVGLTGSYVAIWLAHTAYGLPFAVYLLRNFFSALPNDLFESAHIDGLHICVFSSVSSCHFRYPHWRHWSSFNSCGSGMIYWLHLLSWEAILNALQ